MTTETMIERIARRLCAAVYPGHPELVDARWGGYTPDARIALEAIREPDLEMMEAMVAVGNHCAELNKFVAHGCVAPIFTAAIDAALQEKT